MKKTKFWIDRRSFFAGASITCMIFAVIYRLLGSIPNYADKYFLMFEIGVPVVCALLYIICIVFFGKKGFWLSFIPILFGALYLIFKSFTFESRIYTVACVFIALAVAVLYTSTVFGAISTKWITALVIIVPLIIHIVLQDWPVIAGYRTAEFHSVMLEMSILFIGFGFSFGAFGLSKIASAEKEKSKEITPPVPGQKIGGIFSKHHSEPEKAPGDIKDTGSESDIISPEKSGPSDEEYQPGLAETEKKENVKEDFSTITAEIKEKTE